MKKSHNRRVNEINKKQHDQKITGSVTSSDSGHGSCVQADTHSNCSEGSSGLYHVASSIVHNSPSPTLQQRRHSAIHASGLYMCSASPSSSSSTSTTTPPPLPPHHTLHTTIEGIQQQLQQQQPQQPPPLPPSLSHSNNSSTLLTQNTLIIGPCSPVGGISIGVSGSPSGINHSGGLNCTIGGSNSTCGGGSGGGALSCGGNIPQRSVPYQHIQPGNIQISPQIQTPPPPHPVSAYAQQHSQTTAQYHTTRNTGHGLMAPPPPKGPRHPPAYSVAAQMARLHRLGRAHSHEGVTSSVSGSYYHPEPGDEDDDEDAQVSAV